MYVRRGSVALAALVGLSLLAVAWAKDAPDAKTMTERTVPAPAGVSAELRAITAGRSIQTPMPVRGTQAEWLKAQAAFDAGTAKTVPELLEKHRVTLERKEVAGVPCFLVTANEVCDSYTDRWLVHLHGGVVLNEFMSG